LSASNFVQILKSFLPGHKIVSKSNRLIKGEPKDQIIFKKNKNNLVLLLIYCGFFTIFLLGQHMALTIPTPTYSIFVLKISVESSEFNL
jgi:hypothetical protein